MKYISHTETHDTGGNCEVDFVILHDGRVLGIDNECVCLYGSMDDFYGWNTVDRQCIDLLKETT